MHAPEPIPEISVIAPLWNEKLNVRPLAQQVFAALHQERRPIELLLVDDASTDGSGELADRLAAENRYLRVVHHPVNRKLGGALKTGFAAATRQWILYIDSDLPIEMEDALAAMPMTDAADLVIGWRMNRGEGLKREVMSWCYNRLIRLLFGLKVRDVNFAFKLFRRDVLRQVHLESEGSFIDAELLLEAHRAGYRIAEIGMNYHARVAGTSTLASPMVVLKLLRELLRFRISDFGFRIGGGLVRTIRNRKSEIRN